MCIFLGAFGGHDFYTQKYPQAWTYLICSLFFWACLIVPGAMVGFQMDFRIVIQSVYNTQLTYSIFVSACIIGALVLVFWIRDLLCIIFKNFKVPVVLKEK